MHVLILNTHPLQTQFFYRSFRYENIGADICHPENLTKIWYSQYEAIIMPVGVGPNEIIQKAIQNVSKLGPVPLLIISKWTLHQMIRKELELINNPMEFIETRAPFNFLIEKLENLVEKHTTKTQSKKQIRIGDLEIDFETHCVTRGNLTIQLRNKEFALLACLMKHEGKVLTRTYILENAWDRNTNILSNTVDVHINRLRHKIDHGFEHPMIRTFPCIGYALVA